MLFSVILPVCNVEAYLSECLESILQQTFTDYEVILVNDGSTDCSGRICDEYAAQHSHINVIHQPNAGQSAARNTGLKAARGSYTFFIDSDDFIISKTFFEQVAQQIQKRGSDIILYKYCSYSDSDKRMSPCAFSMEKATAILQTDELLLHLVEQDAFYAAPWMKAIRRSLLLQYNLFFEEGLTGEDNDWYLRVLTAHPCNISVIDEAFIAYRQRAGSTSRAYRLKNLIDYIYVLEKWTKGVAEADISAQRKEALYGAMAKYYVHLLIGYIRVEDAEKQNYRERIRALHPLLNYGKSQRPRLARKVYSLLGFRGTVFMLRILDKLKG